VYPYCPHDLSLNLPQLASYLSAILSLQSVVILGIGDDLFDIRWRHKVLIPAFASIPILIVYFVDFGVTKMVVPTFLRPYLGELFDLGMNVSSLQSSRG
jgi:UDP-N-acetylglucosamine--dolichyl-phosphate N-acetylglucosaminephosphotransferase